MDSSSFAEQFCEKVTVIPSKKYLAFYVIPCHSTAFHVIPSHSRAFQGFPRHSMSFQGIPSHSMSFKVISSHSMSSYRIILPSQPAPLRVAGFRVHDNSIKCLEISWNASECPGMPWNALEIFIVFSFLMSFSFKKQDKTKSVV